MNTQRIVLGVAMASVLLVAPAHALDKCKVKVDKRTGVLSVTAAKVEGQFYWGEKEGESKRPFFNGEDCVADQKARGCYLGDPGTLEGKTPPDGCTVYLSDEGNSPCQAWVPGCSPGARNIGGCIPYPEASPRIVDNDDGTVTDLTTCLMWEKKTGTLGASSVCPGGPTCLDVHDVNNRYSWSTGSPYNPDGRAFFHFLAELNGPSPFAGHDDWRLPTISELEGLVLAGASPTIDPAFGPTSFGLYWSSSTRRSTFPDGAWNVYFLGGGTTYDPKTDNGYVRAVRKAP